VLGIQATETSISPVYDGFGSDGLSRREAVKAFAKGFSLKGEQPAYGPSFLLTALAFLFTLTGCCFLRMLSKRRLHSIPPQLSFRLRSLPQSTR
jgi:hypothetical protein